MKTKTCPSIREIPGGYALPDRRQFVKVYIPMDNLARKQTFWFDYNGLHGASIKIGNYMITRCGYDNHAITNTAELMNRYQMSRQNIHRALKQLEECGLLIKVKKTRVQGVDVSYKINPECAGRGRMRPVGLQ